MTGAQLTGGSSAGCSVQHVKACPAPLSPGKRGATWRIRGHLRKLRGFPVGKRSRCSAGWRGGGRVSGQLPRRAEQTPRPPGSDTGSRAMEVKGPVQGQSRISVPRSAEMDVRFKDSFIFIFGIIPRKPKGTTKTPNARCGLGAGAGEAIGGSGGAGDGGGRVAGTGARSSGARATRVRA